MNSNTLKRLGAVFFILLMSLSNVGFAISTHFCGGNAVETALSIGEAHLGCGMESESDFCESTPLLNSVKPIPCCKDEAQFIGLSENILSARISTPSADSKTWILPIQSKHTFSRLLCRTYVSFYDIPPPPDILWDRQVTFQTFLI